MKYTVSGFLFALALSLLPSPVAAQQGPEVNCVDCPGFNWIRPYPLSGNWYNPQQSGSGFMFEIQTTGGFYGRLGGIYHHYDETGSPTWATIIGTLQPGEDEVLWELETDLVMVDGGACINCPYQEPQFAGTAGTIRFEFLHRNYGRFQVDDGPWQHIVPLFFGVGGWADFEPHSDQVLPDLRTLGVIGPGFVLDSAWILVMRFGLGPGSINYYSVPALFDQRKQIPGGVQYSLFYTPTDILPFNIGELNCTGSEEAGPLCTLEFDITGPQSLKDYVPEFVTSATYLIRPGNISHNRIDGESEDGSIALTAFRIGVD